MMDETTYQELKRRIMRDLRVDIPNTNHFGKLVHVIQNRERTSEQMVSAFKELRVSVQQDEITSEIAKAFDYSFDGETSFKCPVFTVPNKYQIGLIVGPSGSGKSSILKTIGTAPPVEWDATKCVASHFASADEAQKRLSGVGFNSIPSWLRPYQVLSTGEKFRADMARRIANNAVIDEFTSVVDRNVAKSCAYAAQRLIRSENYNQVTFATCHYDVIEWLLMRVLRQG